jgi:L-fuculose-phosphate aldolase
VSKTPNRSKHPGSKVGNMRLRRELVATALRMNASGINQGTSGNLSARTKTGFLITPSGVPYEQMTPEDLVAMTPDGSPTGRLAPSSEWRFHRDIYTHRSDVTAIVHTHSVSATALACLDRGIPAFHYMVAVGGGQDIRCCPYATFGTQELSDFALAALEGRAACLLGHHGVIATGVSLAKALSVAVEVETLARMYLGCLTVGEPAVLSTEQMDEVLAKFATYGQPQPT